MSILLTKSGCFDQFKAQSLLRKLQLHTLLPGVDDDEALGEYFSTELGVFDAIPEAFRYYIGTEKYGRDLRLSMDMCYCSYGTIIRD